MSDLSKRCLGHSLRTRKTGRSSDMTTQKLYSVFDFLDCCLNLVVPVAFFHRYCFLLLLDLQSRFEMD